jgi:putative DNA primase/helicase
LNIIGEDTLTLGRKNIGAWHGQLGTKLMLISNEVPNLNDSGGVLPSRFIKLRFGVSFFGREDVELRGKLEAELPGIAVRCVGAHQRLIARGRFVQPKAGLALEAEVVAASDPWMAMLAECFVIEAGACVYKAVAFSRFEAWCENNGRMDLMRSNAPPQFGRRLRALVPALSGCRPHSKAREYVGLRLRRKDEGYGAS